MSNDEGRVLMDELTQFVEENHCSWNSVAKALGITQNTISNWKKIGRVSHRNMAAVLDLLRSPNPECSVEECPFRMTQDPVMLALLKLLNSMNERGRLLVYMNALELKERKNLLSEGAFRLSDQEENEPILKASESQKTQK